MRYAGHWTGLNRRSPLSASPPRYQRLGSGLARETPGCTWRRTQMSFRLRRRGIAVATALGLLATSVAATPAQADANNDTSRKLRAAVNADGVFRHLWALEAIGRISGDTRVSGTKGYDRSAAYAEAVLRLAGYRVSKQKFIFKAFRGLEPSVLRQTAPGAARDLEHNILSYSGSGDRDRRRHPAHRLGARLRSRRLRTGEPRHRRHGRPWHLPLRAEGHQRAGGRGECRGRLQQHHRRAGRHARRGVRAGPARGRRDPGARHGAGRAGAARASPSPSAPRPSVATRKPRTSSPRAVAAIRTTW